MKFSTTTEAVNQIKVDCLVIPISSTIKKQQLTKLFDKNIVDAVTSSMQLGDLEQTNQTLLLPKPSGLNAQRLLLVSYDESKLLTFSDLEKMLKTIYSELTSTNCKSAALRLDEITVAEHDELWTVQQAIIKLEQLNYRFDHYKSSAKPSKLKTISFLIEKAKEAKVKKIITKTTALNQGINLTKDLANSPCNIATPSYLAKQAEQIAKNHASVTCKIHNEASLKKQKMGAMLAVGAGSAEESKLIELHYNGGKSGQAPIALVGKGITFDTGGISLKPGPGMEEMKYDMCGAATVLGTIAAAAAMKLPINILAIVPCVENMPDGASYKPGDVITGLSGKTIEILNTDAEGRMILSDALTYAQQFKPDFIVDIATLTGAMVMALGHAYSGYYTDNESVAKQVYQAGQRSTDLAWRMPLHADYVQQTDSDVADMKQIGSRWGGANIAAGFLSRFIEDKQKWMHIDIAGSANVYGNSIGATGRPVGMLIEFLSELKL